MRFHLAVYENGTEYSTQRNCVTCNGYEIGTGYSTHQKMCDFYLLQLVWQFVYVQIKRFMLDSTVCCKQLYIFCFVVILAS